MNAAPELELLYSDDDAEAFEGWTRCGISIMRPLDPACRLAIVGLWKFVAIAIFPASGEVSVCLAGRAEALRDKLRAACARRHPGSHPAAAGLCDIAVPELGSGRRPCAGDDAACLCQRGVIPGRQQLDGLACHHTAQPILFRVSPASPRGREWRRLPHRNAVYRPGSASTARARKRVRCARRLPADMRETLDLVAGSGLSYEDAAKLRRCPLGTIKSRVFRARVNLAVMLSLEDPADLFDDAVPHAVIIAGEHRRYQPVP